MIKDEFERFAKVDDGLIKQPLFHLPHEAMIPVLTMSISKVVIVMVGYLLLMFSRLLSLTYIFDYLKALVLPDYEDYFDTGLFSKNKPVYLDEKWN